MECWEFGRKELECWEFKGTSAVGYAAGGATARRALGVEGGGWSVGCLRGHPPLVIQPGVKVRRWLYNCMTWGGSGGGGSWNAGSFIKPVMLPPVKWWKVCGGALGVDDAELEKLECWELEGKCTVGSAAGGAATRRWLGVEGRVMECWDLQKTCNAAARVVVESVWRRSRCG